MEADGRSERPLGARHRPRRHRDPVRGRAPAGRRGQDQRGPGARGVRRAHLAVEGGIRRHHHPQLQRLGASCDWERTRFTMDPGLSEAVREVFVRLWEEGLLYRGDYIVNWCPRCRTVLSDLEVEHEERDAQLFYIKYGPLTLATVRPETKFGDTALAVHPRDRRYAKYVGKILEVPSVEGTIRMKVVADEAVDPKFGTGVVKVTPAHDPADFEIGKRHGLEV